MSRTVLTDLTIRSLKEGIYFDAKTPAFGIRVGKRTKTWFVIKTKGRIRTVVGHYPELGLSEARTAAKRLMLDPKDRPAASLTFSEVRRRYLTAHPDGLPRNQLLAIMNALDKKAEQSVSNAVAALTKENKITAISKGVYKAN